MSDLIERIESACGPDREIDCEIMCAANGWTFRKILQRAPNGQGVSFRCSDGDKGLYGTPKYTGSLDAAMTLVPSDAFWRLGHDGNGADPSEYRAQIIVPMVGGRDPQGISVAETPALALCAAALKVFKQ